MFHPHVILAVFRRNVLSFFSSILGYLFIIAFVVAGAYAAFDDEFFANNENSLDQLTEWFPQLLVFVIPAITMSIWSDEKKLGTDELLFTLPGSDWDILLGKYLAALFTYTVILAFSLSHAVVLAWIGEPDWGGIWSTFLGYWVAGAALVAIGMFASVLTSSATVAFVLGAALCAIPVYIDNLPGLEALREMTGFREPLSVGGNLSYFALGMVPVSGVVYFGLLAAFFLYLNAVVVGRRLWGGSPQGVSYGWQYALRVLSLAITVVSLSYISSKAAAMRLDMTEENLYTLTPTTGQMLDRIDPRNPVTIDAYITPDVAEEYLQVQKNLYGILRQLDLDGKERVQVRIVDTLPASPEAEEAIKWGVEPVTRVMEERGRQVTRTIFMGIVVRSGLDQVVIPFFDKGTPVEYELTRSIGTVLKDRRLTVGILRTAANLIGEEVTLPDGRRERQEWKIVRELRKQYNVRSVPADEPIDQNVDVLLAAMPSTLENEGIANLNEYLRSGRPAIIIVDAMPSPLRLTDYPGLTSIQMLTGFRQKPALDQLLKTLGIRWNKQEVVFDTFNPHPVYAYLDPEIMFLTSERTNQGEAPCLNQEHPISAPFHEVITINSGHIQRDPLSSLDFVPLIRSRQRTTGVIDVNQMIGWSGGAPGRGEPFQVPSSALDHTVDRSERNQNYIIAARISSREPNGVNAVVLADIDLISDVVFNIWERGNFRVPVDNVPFLLNCCDDLAGSDEYLALRGRYRRPRPLTQVEVRREVFQKQLTRATQEANEKATARINSLREKVEEEVQRIEQNPNIDPGEKRQRARTVREAQSRLVEQEIRRIQSELAARQRTLQYEANQQIKAVENAVRARALMLPPLLPLMVGLMVLGFRLLGEQRGIAKERMVKSRR